MVDTLVAKSRVWEEARGISFTYDGLPLLAMLDEYAMLRQEREEEKRRLKDQKKYSEQQGTEQEVFGSKPTPPARPSSAKKVVGPRANGGTNGTTSRLLSLNSSQNGSRSGTKDGKRDSMKLAAPANFAAISKEDDVSHVSRTDPVTSSP